MSPLQNTYAGEANSSQIIALDPSLKFLLMHTSAKLTFIAVDTIAAYVLAVSGFPVQLIKLSLRMCHASKAFYGIYFMTRSLYGQKCRFNIKLRK